MPTKMDVHDNGCHWDIFTCENSAKYGYLDCLKYAHENGCLWDQFIFEICNR